MRRSADLMQLLTRAERLMAQRVSVVLSGHGIGLDAWRVITLLAGGSGVSMSSLSADAFLPPPSLTRLIDQLVDDNLVYRRVDDVDRRRILAYLTPRGRRLHAGISADLSDLPEDPLLSERLASLIEGLSVTRVTL
ncbi:MarR family winged helix-turn-helix transcriptional regulator [Actinoplanes sp. NPDC051513]|uniref:MarR family winged helix-turn-helix transcriptional regulator n=1 Tax=Actinoplanes sp. NPDC051513 TaxID=3363908 RepID=UPI003791B372